MARASAEQAPSSQPPSSQSLIAEQEAPPHLAGRTLLLVEDNSLNRIVATEMLRKTGARIIEAHNGREAVDLLAEQAVDLVLMDLQMPVMDGFEATRLIRASSPSCRSWRSRRR